MTQDNQPVRHRRGGGEEPPPRPARAIAIAAVDVADVVAARRLPRRKGKRLRCPLRVARPAKAPKLMRSPK